MNPTSDPLRCPHCGQPTAERQDTLAVLRAWCVEHGRHLAPDGSVYEDTAAEILDRAPNTLSNWRANGGGGVRFYRSSTTGRVRYRLIDLATYLDASRKEQTD